MGTTGQPAPVPTGGPLIRDLVIADLHELCERRRAKYGTHLQAGNGRDALTDAYEEALDLCLYLKQALEERAGQTGEHAAAPAGGRAAAHAEGG